MSRVEFQDDKLVTLVCRCGHIDHAPTLLWRPGWIRGLNGGACCTDGCKCSAFHRPKKRAAERPKDAT